MAIADTQIYTSGDNIQLNNRLNQLAMLYVWSNSATYMPQTARLEASSLGSNPLRFTKGIGLNMVSGCIYDFRSNPIKRLPVGENIAAYGVEVDEAGVAHVLAVIAIVADGRMQKENNQEITHIHRITVAAATDSVWSRPVQTEQDTLPSGTYEMFGARVENAAIASARFVFKDYLERPAVIPVQAANQPVHEFSQFWGKGYRFTYPNNLPQVELLAVGTGTSELELYLRKVG